MWCCLQFIHFDTNILWKKTDSSILMLRKELFEFYIWLSWIVIIWISRELNANILKKHWIKQKRCNKSTCFFHYFCFILAMQEMKNGNRFVVIASTKLLSHHLLLFFLLFKKFHFMLPLLISLYVCILYIQIQLEISVEFFSFYLFFEKLGMIELASWNKKKLLLNTLFDSRNVTTLHINIDNCFYYIWNE